MDSMQRGILTLIRSAVTGESRRLSEQFDMEAAMPQIRRHQLLPLVYEGAVRCGVDKSAPVMQKLFQSDLQYLMRSEQQMRAIAQLCSALDSAGVDYMPLKGCNLKGLYPKPEMRLMGDADILIRPGQYETIRPIMQTLGYEEKAESDHELIWYRKDLLVELHKRLIPSYNKDYYRYFGDGWKLAKRVNGTRYGMEKEDEFIYIFTHFAKHYRDGGIGCRHVVDLWIYHRACPQLDEAYILAELDKLQLTAFYQNMTQLISVWFEGAALDERTAFMTDFIFRSGAWGKKENHILSAGVKASKQAGTAQKGRWKWVCSMLFPSTDAMKARYSIVGRYPYLLPLFWPVRWATAILFRRDNIQKQHRELKIASSDKIETYQQALQYVGLDFNFEE